LIWNRFCENLNNFKFCKSLSKAQGILDWLKTSDKEKNKRKYFFEKVKLAHINHLTTFLK
jgi:hypothetical protein